MCLSNVRAETPAVVIALLSCEHRGTQVHDCSADVPGLDLIVVRTMSTLTEICSLLIKNI